MKKLYLFIFLIVIGGVMQIQPVNAHTNKLLNGKKTIALVTPTITFPTISNKVFGVADFSTGATIDQAGLLISYSTTDATVATVVNGNIHINGVGTATIKASYAGDGINYNAAADKTQTITVTKGGTAVLSGLTATTIALQSTDVAFAATSTFNPATFINNPITYTSSNTSVATIVNGRLHMVGSGATTITASQTTASGNLNFTDATPITAVYTINPPVAPVFTTSLAGKVVGGADFDPAATVGAYYSTITYTSSNPAVASIINNKIHLIAPCTAGSVTITAVSTYPVGAGGTATVTTPNTTLAITAAAAGTVAAPVITLTSPGNKVFGDIDIALTATTTYTLPVPITFTTNNPAIATIVNGNLHLVAPGTGLTITASQGGGTGNATTPADVTTAAINITAPTLTMAAIAKVNNAADFAPPVVATLTNTPVVYAVTAGTNVAVIQNGVVHLTGAVGTATIKASQQNNISTTISPATTLLPADITAVLTVTAATAPVITFAALGSKQYSTTELAAGATSTLTSPAITYTSSNPSVAYITSNAVATTAPTSFGSGYTPGTYLNVPLTGGTGTGALANITVSSGGQAIATLTNGGKNYNAADILSFNPLSLNNTTNGSGFVLTVATVSLNNVHYVSAPATPNNTTIITASQGGGSQGTLLLPPDVQQTLVVTPPTINFPALGTKTYTAQDFNPGVAAASASTRLIYLTSSNPAVATITATQAYALTSGGTLYTNGTYTNVPLIGGTGTGMVATIVVATNSVTATGTIITSVGTNYTNGDVLTCPASAIGGTGSGFTITLGAYTGVIHYNSTVPAAPNNTSVITASMGGGVSGTITLAPDVSQTLTLTNPVINFPALGTKPFTSTDINPGATGALIGLPITYTSSNPLVATIVNGYIHFTGAPAAPNNTTIITASQAPLTGVNIGTQSIPGSVQQTLTVTPPVINFPTLGTKTIGPDFNAGATSTITNVPITYTSSNTAVATISVNGISSTNTTSFGVINTYGKAATYVNVPLTGGTGTGAKGIVIITSAGQAAVGVTTAGTGYTIGDVLSFAASSIGSATGTGFSMTVTGVSNMVHYVGSGTTTITAQQGGGASGTLTLPADASQVLTVVAPIINFPLIGTKQFSSTDVPLVSSSTLNSTPVTYSVPAGNGIASIVTGAITTLATPTGGSGYTDGVYNLSLTGGTGTGAAAAITAVGGNVTSVVITSNTSGYSVGDVLTTTITPGTGFNVTVTGVGSALRFVSAPASPGNTVAVTASQGGGATGTGTLPADVTQTVTVTPPTINFPALGTKAYPQVDIILSATSPVNKAFTYTSSNTAVATISVVSVPGAGTTTYLHLVAAPAAPNNTAVITASQGGGATGTTTLPADVSQTVSVIQVLPKFTFPALGTRILTNVDVPLSVTSPLAGVPITYSSSNTAVATVVNGKAHMVSVGTAIITASQGGGAAGTLTIPADATQSITITAPTFTFPALGTKPYSPVDFNAGATSSITNIPVTYTSSNPLVATTNTTLLFNASIGGSGYKDGTYNNVPLTGGTGSGALATVVVSSGSVVSVTPTNIGTLYTPGDVLSCQALSIGGVGNGFNVTVASYYTLIHMIPAVPAAPNNTTVITASLGGGAAGTASLPADISQTLTVVTPTITFPALGTVTYTPIDFSPNATTTFTSPSINYTSSNPAVATINNSLSLGTLTGGSGYFNGTYSTVNLTGGAGTGAQAKIVVAGGAVTSVTITSAGKFYATGDALTCPAASIGGGTGSGFKVLVGNFSSMVHLVLPVPASPNNTSNITASVTGAVTSFPLPADVTQTLTVTAPTYTFPAIGSKVFTTTNFDPAATSTVPGIITYTSSDTTLASIVNNKVHLVKIFSSPSSATITATQNGLIIGTGVLTAVTSPTAITFPSLGGTIAFRTADIIPSATSSNTTVGMTYTSSDPTVASIVNGAVHILKPGTVSIKASQQNTTYTPVITTASGVLPADATQSLTITQPVITFTALGSRAFTITDASLAATSTITSLPITYTSSDTTVATIVNGNIHYVRLGTTTITASQTAAATLAGLPIPAEVQQSLVVTAPTLTFAALGSPKVWTATDLPIATTTGTVSTLGNLSPIVITSSDPSVVSIVYTAGIPNIHYVGIGTCNITASQAGYGKIPAPASVSQVFTVTPATIVVAAAGAKTTASADAAPTVTVTLPITTVPLTYTTSDPTVATFVGGIIHVVGVGSCVLTVSQVTSANYQPVPATQTVVVTAPVTTTPLLSFTTPLGTKQYTNGGDITPAVTAPLTTVAVTFTSSNPLVATIVNSLIHLTPPAIINGVVVYPNPATTVITASQGGGPNGVPGSLPADVSQVLTVTPASITFPPLGIQRFSTIDLNPGATSSYTLLAADNTALPITYTSSDPTVATIVNNQIHFVGAGSTVITASLGNVVVPDVSQTMIVVTPILTFPATATKIFTTVDAAPGATSTNTNPIGYTSSDPTIATIISNSINTLNAVTAGTGYKPGLYNNIPLTGGTGTGAQANISVSATGQATATLTVTGKGYTAGDVLTFTAASLGTTPVSGSGFTTTVGSLGGALLHCTGIGVVTITATQSVGTPATTIAATQILTITTPSLTLAATRAATFTITDQDPGAVSTVTTVPVTYTSSNPALVSIVNNKLHFNVLTPTSAGYDNVAIITASQVAVGNYPTLTAAQTLTVNQGIVVQSALTKYYGDPDFSPAVSSLGYPVAYSSATVATATVVSGGNLVHILAPGSSVITASQPGDASTPAAATATVTLTVAPAPLIISPKNVTRLYGVENPVQYPLVYTGFKSSTGTAPLDDSTKFTVQPVLLSITSAANPTVNLLPSLGGFIPKTLPAGVYTLTYGGAASTFYSILYGTGTLTVNQAPQTLTYDQGAITKKYGDIDFDPLARSTGDPVVYTSSNTAIATILNGKVHIVGVGTATITASLSATSGNYTGTGSIPISLTVGLGTQTITASTIPFLLKGSGNYAVSATASSGLPVQLVVADPLIATSSGTNIQPLHIGKTTVTVKQPGSALYSAAADVVLYLNVIDNTGEAVEVHLAVSPNGDGINDFLLIEGVQDYPGNHVNIINRNGIKVFSTDNYDNKGNVFTGKSNGGDQLPAGTYFYRVDYNVGDQKNHITGYFVLKY